MTVIFSRDLREKTSIEATTGGALSDSVHYLGSRRKKNLIPHDSTALLNQLRHEEQEKVREARRQVCQTYHFNTFTIFALLISWPASGDQLVIFLPSDIYSETIVSH